MSDEDSAQLKADCAFLYYVRNAQRCKKKVDNLLRELYPDFDAGTRTRVLGVKIPCYSRLNHVE